MSSVGQKVEDFFAHLAHLVSKKITALQALLHPLEQQVGTIAEDILKTSVAAGAQAFSAHPPEGLTLDAFEKSLILAGRAVLDSAKAQGEQTLIPAVAHALAALTQVGQQTVPGSASTR